MKTPNRQILGIIALLSLVAGQTTFAASVLPVQAFGSDTVAGYETVIRSSQLQPWQSVSFTVTKPDGSSLQLTGNSGANGIAEVNLASNQTRMAGVYNVQAVFGQNSNGLTSHFQVYPDKVSPNQSSVSIDKTIVEPNSKDIATVTVGLTDAYGNPIHDHLVQIYSDRPQDSVVSISPNGVTDSQGKIQFTVSSSNRGISHYSVLDDTAGVMIIHQVSVAYIAGSEFMADVGGELPFVDTAKADSSTQGSGTLASFSITGLPSSIQPNQNVDFTVTALDQNNQTVQNYTGTVHFSSGGANSSNVTLPQDYTFTATDLGTHTFSLGLGFKAAGSYTISVTDLSNTLLTGNLNVTVGSNGSTQQTGSGSGITLDSPVAGTYSQKNQVISGSGIAGDSVIIYDNQQQIGTVQITPDGKYSFQTPPLADGQHSVYAEMLDSSQNSLGKSAPVVFTIQTASPKVANITVTPTTGVNPGDTITVSITSEKNLSQAAIVFNGDIVNLNPSLDDPTVYTGTVQAPSTPGTYPVDVLLVDQLSNEGSYKAQAQVTVSSTEQAIAAPTQELTQQPTEQVTQQLTQQATNPAPSKVSGVLAYAGNMKVTLVWDAAVDTTTYIQHYRIYYGTDPKNLTQYADTKDASTTWYIPNLSNGLEYYFSISAFDPTGVESAQLSDVVNATPFTTEASNLGQVAGPIGSVHPAASGQFNPPPATSSTGPELLWFVFGSGGIGGLVQLRKKRKK